MVTAMQRVRDMGYFTSICYNIVKGSQESRLTFSYIWKFSDAFQLSRYIVMQRDGMLKSPEKGKLTSIRCYCGITVKEVMIPRIREWTYIQK
jgi:hypothetical protein